MISVCQAIKYAELVSHLGQKYPNIVIKFSHLGGSYPSEGISNQAKGSFKDVKTEYHGV